MTVSTYKRNDGKQVVQITYSPLGEQRWRVPDEITSIDCLVIGGGGGGGGTQGVTGVTCGGGGGAGGLFVLSNYSVTPGQYILVNVGYGGYGRSSGTGVNGSNTTFISGSDNMIAYGGQGGGTAAWVPPPPDRWWEDGTYEGNAYGGASGGVKYVENGTLIELPGSLGGSHMTISTSVWQGHYVIGTSPPNVLGGAGGGHKSYGVLGDLRDRSAHMPTSPVNTLTYRPGNGGNGFGSTMNSANGTVLWYAGGGAGGTSFSGSYDLKTIYWTKSVSCQNAIPGGGGGSGGPVGRHNGVPGQNAINYGGGGGGASGPLSGPPQPGGDGFNGVVIIVYTPPLLPEPPNAKFTINTTSGNPPLAIKCTDISSNNPTSWLWTFEDSALDQGYTTSTEQHPSRVYTEPGYFKITLTASNIYGSNSYSLYVNVKTQGGGGGGTEYFPPNSRWTVTPSHIGNAPFSAAFCNLSTGTITSVHWDFGDNTESIVENPTHIYTRAGKYKVTLTVGNRFGSKSSSQNIIVNPSTPPDPNPPSPSPKHLRLYDLNITTSLDSKRSYNASVACNGFIYTFGGTIPPSKSIEGFKVESNGSLTALDGLPDLLYIRHGASATSCGNYIYIFGGCTTIGGCLDPLTSIEGFEVNPSTGALTALPTLISLERGTFNGCAVTSGNFVYLINGYYKGNYELDGVVATSDARGGRVEGFSVNTGTGVLTRISSPLSTPLYNNYIPLYKKTGSSFDVSYALGSKCVCIGDKIIITGGYIKYVNSVFNGITILSRDETGHLIQDTTPYNNYWMERGEKYNHALTSYDNHIISFGGQGNGYMNFTNDITIYSIDLETGEIKYDNSSSLPVVIGCNDAVCVDNYIYILGGSHKTDPYHLDATTKIIGYTVFNDVVAKYTFNLPTHNKLDQKQYIGYPKTISFTDLSSGDIISWNWNFGDGGTSTEQHPSHTFLNEGSYTVTLTVSNGVDTSTCSTYTFVCDPSYKLVSFIQDKTEGILPFSVQFTADVSFDAASYLWDFGDGNTSTEQNPLHLYEEEE